MGCCQACGYKIPAPSACDGSPACSRPLSYLSDACKCAVCGSEPRDKKNHLTTRSCAAFESTGNRAHRSCFARAPAPSEERVAADCSEKSSCNPEIPVVQRLVLSFKPRVVR